MQHGHNMTFDTEPYAGFYRLKLRQGAPLCGVRIWHGPPRDPLTDEILDRGWRWQAEANGRYIEIERVWPRCAKDPIDRATYEKLAALTEHALAHNPADPMATPERKVDWGTMPMPF